MYKSDRTFKDFEDSQPIKDPRFAYLKQCWDMNMLPKAKMIIWEEEQKNSKRLDYANFRLQGKTCAAVAEAIKIYPLEIEEVDFSDNGLWDQDLVSLLTSLDVHFKSILTLNLSENQRLGIRGGEALANAVIEIPALMELDLS